MKRTDNQWSAEYQKQIFYDSTERLKSVDKKHLDEPKSGWENFWSKITSEELLTLADGIENGGSDPCPDCEGFLVESNIGGDYRFYLYTQPSLQSKLRETRQAAKISNLVADEFGLNEFAAKSFIE